MGTALLSPVLLLECLAFTPPKLSRTSTSTQQLRREKGWAAVQRAKQLGGKTPREQAYIAAVEVVFKDHETVPFGKRAAAYEKALEQIHVRYPEDSEAAILYAYWLQVTANRNDQTYAQQLKSAKILEKIFVSQPNHPGVAHFIIHAYDFPSVAEHGLDAARRYASIAPDSPHALHMPSHIFSRVGAWQDSIDTNRRSLAVSTLDRDVYHAMDYIVYASLINRRWHWLSSSARYKAIPIASAISTAPVALPSSQATKRTPRRSTRGCSHKSAPMRLIVARSSEPRSSLQSADCAKCSGRAQCLRRLFPEEA